MVCVCVCAGKGPGPRMVGEDDGADARDRVGLSPEVG